MSAQFGRPTIRHRWLSRHGLTLLELLVVLVILTVVATVAVTSLQPRVEAARFEQTGKTLDAISEAVIGPRQSRQVDGTPLISGFVADVGRLPNASLTGAIGPELPSNSESSNPVSESVDTSTDELSELWNEQSGLARDYPYQFRPGPASPVDYSDVKIPCGWRGPYLQTPGNLGQLLDAWGREFEFRIDSNSEVVSVVTSTQSVEEGQLACDLRTGRVSVSGTINSDQPLPANLQVALLAPDPDSSTTELVVQTDESNSPESFQFSSVTVGLRAICVNVDGQRVYTRYVQVPHEGLSFVIDLSGKLTATDE